MTPAERRYQRAGVRLRIVRAQLLLQVSGPDRDASLANLLDMAQVLGKGVAEELSADSVSAFRAAMTAELQAAEAELRRLPGPDEGRP